MAETITLKDKVHNWGLAGDRRFLSLVLPYGEARTIFRPDVYNALNGRGEQRQEIDGHVRAIRKDMMEGNFTPTPVSAGLRKRHLERLVECGKGEVSLEVDPGDPLPLTDGQQRFGALRQIAELAEQAGDAELLDKVLGLPVSVMVHVDGDTQRDFLNLQKGKPVATDHLLSLRIQQKLVGEKDYASVKLAADTAKALNGSVESPFHKIVRFDSKGMGSLPLTTLCSRGASDLGTSLVGLARVGLSASIKDSKKLAYYVVSVANGLREHAPELLGDGLPLTPPPEGTRGSCTMLVGLAVCLAYRLKVLGRALPEAEDLEKMAEAAKATMARPISGNFSSQTKRLLLREFAAEFFADLKVERHEGVPAELVRTLSASAYGCRPIAKAKEEAAATPARRKKPSPAGDGHLASDKLGGVAEDLQQDKEAA
jgi:hypothetical protein